MQQVKIQGGTRKENFICVPQNRNLLTLKTKTFKDNVIMREYGTLQLYLLLSA